MTLIQPFRKIKWKYLSRNNTLLALQKQIGYFFKSPKNLTVAFTHKSLTPTPSQNYERLEFLGDAILNQIVTELLINHHPNEDEGTLTKRRAALVSKSYLVKMGKKLKLILYLNKGNSIRLESQATVDNLEADLFESLLGAIYTDGGYLPTKRFIEKTIWKERLITANEENYKGLLIELCQRKNLPTPKFVVLNTMGDDHNRIYEIGVKIGSSKYGHGTGRNKKAAEQVAAMKTLESLGKDS